MEPSFSLVTDTRGIEFSTRLLLNCELDALYYRVDLSISSFKSIFSKTVEDYRMFLSLDQAMLG